MDSNLRTAYILQVHKNPDQINKFINQLISDEQADVYVHIDRKSFNQLKGKIVDSPRVKILTQSISCDWGDISQVDTTLLLLREVIASKIEYDFVCLRSGQDLLIKDGFKDYLMENKDKIFITLRDVSWKNLGLMEMNWSKMTRKRYTTAHPIRIYRRIMQTLYRSGINISPNTKPWPKDYSFYVGSQWFTIPFDVASYIMKFLDENEWYRDYFENTMCPDEWFFQTLIMNSHYKENVVNNNLFYFNWGATFSDRNSPLDLTMEDMSAMEESGQYFARKFDEKVNPDIINYFANKTTFARRKSARKEEVNASF
ncbi:beta-1,6-N-acetylglucosaminyltransferase [Anaerobacillus isosaccharinicus]|uniref:Peptide O-xylosyltransferase n=1 Tax=Anaerobacillus isosaccharinicus TaxID=1532552 RepID=A0A1S2KXH4_9BACI|nr:beta-1,6-N-acetylglucosaminyltransferase [Anaerobacillus isosaccharinicus]MBA5586880.1 hypothetical protein [Anaerobacillus isosaccharinicus]QOY34910.1 hypothetical protein AWH56_019650 [Anaerobacillus isosaccharinicus]